MKTSPRSKIKAVKMEQSKEESKKPGARKKEAKVGKSKARGTFKARRSMPTPPQREFIMGPIKQPTEINVPKMRIHQEPPKDHNQEALEHQIITPKEEASGHGKSKHPFSSGYPRPTFLADSIPTPNNSGDPPLGYTYNDQPAWIYNEEEGTMTLVERKGVKPTPEQIKAAGGIESISELEALPGQPSWFPSNIQMILDSERCPEAVPLNHITDLAEYQNFLAKEGRKRWTAYVNAQRGRNYYRVLLDQYKGKTVPPAILHDTRHRHKLWKRNATAAMANLECLVQGQRYLDPVMHALFESEREVYERFLPKTGWL